MEPSHGSSVENGSETRPPQMNGTNMLSTNLCRNLSKKQLHICCIFVLLKFCVAMARSIYAPFFPEVAVSKEASPIEYGLIFPAFEMTVWITAPVLGSNINFFGPKKLVGLGVLMEGACSIIFGFLNFLEGRVAFVLSCLIIRICQALGDAAFLVGVFCVLAFEFPGSVGITYGSLESVHYLGLGLGPILGGYFYELGGYTFPFAVLGGVLLLCAGVACALLPEQIEPSSALTIPPPTEGGRTKCLKMSGLKPFQLLRYPVMLVTAWSIVATSVAVGFVHSTLETHLDFTQANLSKSYMALVLILPSCLYCLTAPMWGGAVDVAKEPKYLTLIGCILIISAFIFIGPLPYLPWKTRLWNICVGLVLYALGMGAILISAYVQGLRDAGELGYPDDISTYGLIIGLWTPMMGLGFFIGASVGGILSHYLGFRPSTFFVLGGQCILLMMVLLYFKKKKESTRENNSGDTAGEGGNEIPLELVEPNSI